MVDAWLTKMAFKHMLIKRAYTKEDFERMVQASKFGGCGIAMDSMGMEVRCAKAA